MAFYFTVEREGKWEVLFSHVNGEDLIKKCNTEEQAEALVKVLEDEDVVYGEEETHEINEIE